MAEDLPPFLTTSEAAQRMDLPGVVLLDVRRPEELEVAHVRHTLHVVMSELPEWFEQGGREQLAGREVLCLCHHGVRSGRVTDWLRERGINARNILGGIDAWSHEVDPSVPVY